MKNKSILYRFGLVVLVLVINLLGDWLRDVFNPKIYKG